MTFHQLEIFGAVAEQASITQAARKIKISQPSVSKQLRFLERECGIKLYVKSGRGIKITEEGRMLHNAAKPILKQMEELRSSFLTRVSDARDVALRVGSTPSPGAFFLPGVLKSFVKLHPKIHPTLRTGYPDALKAMVLDGEVDVAVTTIAPSHPEIIEEAIASEGIVAIVSAKHPLATKKSLTESEVGTVPFIMTTDGRIADEIKKIGLRLNVVMWCESVDLKKAAVEAGLGVGLFYRGSAEAGLRQGYFKALEIPKLENIKITCYVIYQRAAHVSPNLNSFLSLLRRSSKQNLARSGRH
ncbi:MAG TPA: LysR family transcriptional regulator [Candidatus Eisenbacteria bacterium]|nr:LysR family transcriptional regulator [Candidatus Eisenbacteria bacterium]